MRTILKIGKTGGAGLLAMGLILVLSACGRGQIMDQPAQDGNFYYQNKNLGFEVTLPPSFEYYQTQRQDRDDYSEVLFLVPTSDTSAFQVVDGYANPLAVRVYKQERDNYGEFQEFGRKDGNYYVVDFWDQLPRDWRDKWNQEIEEGINDSLKLN